MIDREGTFKATPIDWGVSVSSGGCPQLVMKLAATEIWDDDEQAWVDWSEYAQEITGYFILFSKKNEETMTCQKIKEALGWDGTSFADLDAGDFMGKIVQIRVENDTYDGKTKLKVCWIDKEDAVPGSSVKKLDADAMKQLDAKFAQFMKKSAKPVAAPAKAKKKVAKPKTPKTPKKTAEPPIGDVPGDPPAAPEPPAETAEQTLPDERTKAEAWATVNELAKEEFKANGGGGLAKIWLDAIHGVADTNDQDKVTPAQWGEIEKIVLDQVSVV